MPSFDRVIYWIFRSGAAFRVVCRGLDAGFHDVDGRCPQPVLPHSEHPGLPGGRLRYVSFVSLLMVLSASLAYLPSSFTTIS